MPDCIPNQLALLPPSHPPSHPSSPSRPSFLRLGSLTAARHGSLRHDVLLDLVGVVVHHAHKRRLRAADDRTEALLANLLLRHRVEPACVIVRNKDTAVGLVPVRETLVHVGPHGTQVAGDEVDNAREFGFAVWIKEAGGISEWKECWNT